MRNRIAMLIGAARLPMATPAAAQAPAYPDKPIRIVVPFPVGGIADTVGREIGRKLTETWGQFVVIRTPIARSTDAILPLPEPESCLSGQAAVPFDIARQGGLGAPKVVGGVRPIVHTGHGQVNRGHHRPRGLAQRAGDLHGVE